MSNSKYSYKNGFMMSSPSLLSRIVFVMGVLYLSLLKRLENCLVATVWLQLFDCNCLIATVWLQLFDCNCLVATVWLPHGMCPLRKVESLHYNFGTSAETIRSLHEIGHAQVT